MKIELTKGKVALVSPEDYPEVSKYKWYYHNGGYAARKTPRPEHKTIFLHRVLMGEPNSLEVDHINGDKLDNRRENLRVCTRSQNNINKSFDGKSGYRGVTEVKRDGRWKAQISHRGEHINLGQWATPEIAAKKYNKAALELHGEFARLNEVS